VNSQEAVHERQQLDSMLRHLSLRVAPGLEASLQQEHYKSNCSSVKCLLLQPWPGLPLGQR